MTENLEYMLNSDGPMSHKSVSCVTDADGVERNLGALALFPAGRAFNQTQL